MKSNHKWRLDSLSVRSFRGIAGNQQLKLGGRSALLYGNNGVGKSTLALAVQWTMFGKFPSGVLPNTGFKNFIPPVSANKGAFRGELRFSRGDKFLVVTRDDDDSRKFILAAGSKIFEGQQAERERDAALGLDMDTFARAVLLHQSRIRGLLLDEAKDRNHAIDMLLGVDATQSLYEALKTKPFQDAAAAWRSGIESAHERHGAQRDLLQTQYDSALERARLSGFANKDFNWTALANHYENLAATIRELARKHGVQAVDLNAPTNARQAHGFHSVVARELGQLQINAKSQVRLQQQKHRAGRLQMLLNDWDQNVRVRDEAQALVAELEASLDLGGDAQPALEASDAEVDLQENRLRDLGQLHKLLVDASAFVANQHESACPVCRQAIEIAALATDLDARIRSLSSKELIHNRSLLESLKKRRSEFKSALERLAEQRRQVTQKQTTLDTLRATIAAEMEIHILSEAKLRQRLTDFIEIVEGERRVLEADVESLANHIAELTTKASKLQGGLLSVILKREEMADHENQKEKLNSDNHQAEAAANSMEIMAADLERIRIALLAAKEQLASDRLKRARPRSVELYQRLVRHPKFTSFDIAATAKAKKVEYNFEVSICDDATMSREARLVLSDGQITATAVAIFLALAESAAHDLDVLFIDDPTQNLDLPCKDAMVRLMVEIASKKQLIIATHDEDFVSYLKEYGFDKQGLMFHLQKWDGNPKIATPNAVT